MSSAAGVTITLDLRGLPPPEPMEQILAAIATLSAGAALLATTSREPRPLLPILGERGYAWRIEHNEPGNCTLRIWRADGPAPP